MHSIKQYLAPLPQYYAINSCGTSPRPRLYHDIKYFNRHISPRIIALYETPLFLTFPPSPPLLHISSSPCIPCLSLHSLYPFFLPLFLLPLSLLPLPLTLHHMHNHLHCLLTPHSHFIPSPISMLFTTYILT